MAKFASKDERTFNPIQEKLLGGLVRPVPTSGEAIARAPVVSTVPEDPPPAAASTEPEPAADPVAQPTRSDAPPKEPSMSEPTRLVERPSPPSRSWPASPGAPDSQERLTRTLRCLMTPEDERRYKDLAQRLSRALVAPPSLRGRDRGELQSQVSLSHLVRACLEFLVRIEPELHRELEAAQLARPNNDRRAIAAFETRLTEIIERACRPE